MNKRFRSSALTAVIATSAAQPTTARGKRPYPHSLDQVIVRCHLEFWLATGKPGRWSVLLPS